MNKDKKNPWNYNFLGRKEQPLSAHMAESGPIDEKSIGRYAKKQVRLFKQKRKDFNKQLEENKRKAEEYNFQKKMQRLEKERKRVNEEINKINNSRVIDG
jgi:esterase/lipase